ncbi:MAG: hypothetical protein KF819_11420 [Labilithrix sp.]|nr:hypothetical protein [Labilithrix sp.]
MLRGPAFLLLLSLFLGSIACTSTGSVTEGRPLESPFAAYRTATIEVDAAGMPNGTKDGELFLAYLESQLRKNGLLEPVPLDRGAELILRTRMTPSHTAEDDVRMLVDFVDAKSRRTIGQITVTGNALGDKSAAALRAAANEIIGYMRSNRGAGKRAPAIVGAAPAAPPAPTATPGVYAAGGCTTTCRPDATSTVSADDLGRVSEGFTPMLREMRTCLDRVSAQAIHPVIILRFEAPGVLTQLRSDTGGYDDLACVYDARSRPPGLTITAPASVRCELRCR